MKKKILIIADIEGSSGCLDREASQFLGRGWPCACRSMSLDIRSLAGALLDAGAAEVHVQDFHRTGYNIFPELVPAGASLSQGYRQGPVPGIGRLPGPFDGVMMVGMHAPSGSHGFLAHTLTSRIAAVTIEGHLVSEAQLFSAALAPFGIPPLFFSGCPVACDHVRSAMAGVRCFPVEKSDPAFHPAAWRAGLAEAAVTALISAPPPPYNPRGPFQVRVSMAGGRTAARKIESAWGCRRQGCDLILTVPDFNTLFSTLSRMIYMTPLTFRLLPLILPLYHLVGRAGLAWAQKKPLSARQTGADEL